MSPKQREAFEDLKTSIWDVGWAYGFQGATVLDMLQSLHREIGDRVPDWMVSQLEHGHNAGAMDRAGSKGTPEEKPPERDDPIPF